MRLGLIIVYIESMHGRPGDKKFMQRFSGQKRERVSVIGALMDGMFKAPFTFKGSCNSDLLNIWLQEVLLPILPQGAVLVMDNAAFHKSVKTKQLIESFGCQLLFLPPYSPDLNPIEHWWHKIKSILRPLIQQDADKLHNLLDQCLST